MSNSVGDILKSIREQLCKEYDDQSSVLDEITGYELKNYYEGVIDGLEQAIDIVDKIGKETI